MKLYIPFLMLFSACHKYEEATQHGVVTEIINCRDEFCTVKVVINNSIERRVVSAKVYTGAVVRCNRSTCNLD